MPDTKFYDREFERRVLNPEILKLMNRLGASGERISKLLISQPGPLRAVDKSILLNSMGFEPNPAGKFVRVGTNVEYANFVFLGTSKMKARPVLRTMLHMLTVEQKGK